METTVRRRKAEAVQGTGRIIQTRFKNCAKRVIFLLNEKGGVGKTHLARLIMGYLMAHPVKLSVLGIDFDERDNQDGLRSVFPGSVEWINAFQEEEKDRIMAYIDASDVVVVDTRASMQEKLILSWINDTDLVGQAQEGGIGVTYVYPINDSLYPIHDLRSGLELYGDQVDFLVAKNEYFTTNWRLFEESTTNGIRTADLARENGAGVISIPTFRERNSIIKAWSEHKRPITDTNPVLPDGTTIPKGLINVIEMHLAHIEAQFEQVQDKLLPTKQLLELEMGATHPWYSQVVEARLRKPGLIKDAPIQWRTQTEG